MTDIFIKGGRALLNGEILETSLSVADGKIRGIGSHQERGALELDARDLMVLPGIVDLHGDAFERQMMPRPGVDFPIDVALIDSDRQAIANGMTTVFHATTWSWEPGLRSGDNAERLLAAIEALRPRLVADTRFHLRHETYNLDAEEKIGQWLAQDRIDLFAFNDHNHHGAAKQAPEARHNDRTHGTLGRGVRGFGGARAVPRRRSTRIDRASGSDRTRGRCADALA